MISKSTEYILIQRINVRLAAWCISRKCHYINVRTPFQPTTSRIRTQVTNTTTSRSYPKSDTSEPSRVWAMPRLSQLNFSHGLATPPHCMHFFCPVFPAHAGMTCLEGCDRRGHSAETSSGGRRSKGCVHGALSKKMRGRGWRWEPARTPRCSSPLGGRSRAP